MSDISLQTVIERHLGTDWLFQDTGLHMMSAIRRGFGPSDDKLSDFGDNGDYIDVDFEVSTNHLLWASGWTESQKTFIITANCAWRIHPDTYSNIDGLVEITDILPDVLVGEIHDHKIYGYGALITVHGNPEVGGTEQILIEHADGSGGHSITTVTVEVQTSGHLIFALDPSSMNVGCEEVTYNFSAIGVIDKPDILSSPSWVLNISVGAVSNNTSIIHFMVAENKQSCNPLTFDGDRIGSIWVGHDGMALPFYIFQDGCLKTDPVWPSGSSQTVYDADGNGYQYITIGDYQVLLQNLRTTKYRDGSDIPGFVPSGSTNMDFVNERDHAYCIPYNNELYKPIGGLLYNYFAVAAGTYLKGGFMDPSSDVPGYGDEYQWHVPTEDEVWEIINAIDPYWDAINDPEYVEVPEAGNKMKCPMLYSAYGYPGWTGATGDNDSKFSALASSMIQGAEGATQGHFVRGHLYHWIDQGMIETSEPYELVDYDDYDQIAFYLGAGTDGIRLQKYKPPGYVTVPWNGFAIRLIRKHDLNIKKS